MRYFHERGIEQFRSYLAKLQQGSTEPPPRHLLHDDSLTELWTPAVTIEPVQFTDRLHAGKYFVERLGNQPGLEENVGLWSWLSLYYFDQVCPRAPDGTRSPGRDYRHIVEPGYLSGHRHLLAGAYLVYRLHGEHGKLLLCSKVHRENLFHHELMSRQALGSNAVVVAAVTALYFDERRGQAKPRAQANVQPGSIFRFVEVIQQLEVNYDLYSMDAASILALLPQEFEMWRQPQRRWRWRWRRERAPG